MDRAGNNVSFCNFYGKMDNQNVMRFRIGQEVVCIKKGAWHHCRDHRESTDIDPKYNEIVTVSGYRDNESIFLHEYGRLSSYQDHNFAPILENLDEIKEALNETVEI